jgi:hypothetical protein
MVSIGDGELLLLLIGAGGALWCVGLVLCLAYVDERHRAKMVRHVGEAFLTMLIRMGERRRQNGDLVSPA